jgi:hypothetical protein
LYLRFDFLMYILCILTLIHVVQGSPTVRILVIQSILKEAEVKCMERVTRF